MYIFRFEEFRCYINTIAHYTPCTLTPFLREPLAAIDSLLCNVSEHRLQLKASRWTPWFGKADDRGNGHQNDFTWFYEHLSTLLDPVPPQKNKSQNIPVWETKWPIVWLSFRHYSDLLAGMDQTKCTTHVFWKSCWFMLIIFLKQKWE